MNIQIKDIYSVLKENGKYVVSKKDIYIKNDLICGIGQKPENFTADKIIDGENKLVMPGLINCHTHTYMSLFRNLADDLSFEDWLFKNIMPMEDKLTPEDAYWGGMLACVEMIKTGTTCFLDMHMFKNQTAKAAVDIGMRAVISRGLSGNGKDSEGSVRRIKEAFDEIDEWKNNEMLSFMIAPHAIYTCDTELLEYSAQLAKEHNLPLNIHLSETKAEVKDSLKNYGLTPVQYLDKIGFFDVKTIAAHCVHLTDNDMDILSSKKVSVAANPMSNLKLGNGFAPILKLMEKGVNICIGTDSAASNNTLNLFSDMNYTALIHKGTNENPEAVGANDVLSFVTENAAIALGLNSIGSLQIGKKADLTIIDLKYPQFYPKNNLISAIAYSANGSEVDTVIINGNIVMENKKLCTVDEYEVYRKAEEAIQRLGGA